MLPKQGEITVTLTYTFPNGLSMKNKRKAEEQLVADISFLTREVGKHLAPKIVEAAASIGDGKE